MRIAVVTESAARIGGVEAYLERIVPQLTRQADVAFFARSAETASERGSIRLPVGIHQVERGGAGLLAALHEWRPDVVFAHGINDADVELRLTDLAPVVFAEHNYHGVCISGSRTFRRPSVQACHRRFGPSCLAIYLPRRCGGNSPITMLRLYGTQLKRRRMLARCAAIVTLSHHVKRVLELNGLDGRRIHVIPPFVPPEPGDRRIDARPSESIRLLFLGRLEPLKGVDRLLAALPHVARQTGRPVTLVIAGDGAERARLEAQASTLVRSTPSVAVRFTGWVDDTAKAALLGNTDALVIPSLWPEPFGLVGIEAAAAGVPAVGFATGGIPEWLIDGETGCLAPARHASPEALAAAIVRCVADPRERARLAAGARRAAARRTVQVHVNQLAAVLRDAAQGRTAPA